MTKNEIAELLNEIGVLLELKGENPVQDPRLSKRRPGARGD